VEVGPVSRPTTTERGYGVEHQAERERWRPVVEAGEAVCSRCHSGIAPDVEWDLDHHDDRSGWSGPAHATCNRAAGARKGNAQRALGAGVTIRRWGEA
jgi:hypothetical protein